MSNKYLKFAVVGHPNKGKSSIVSTLSMNDNIEISPIPGTTTKCRAYPLKIDGETIYELYDTPGFQRPRAVLEWLQKEKVPANMRRERVIEFVQKHINDNRFADDIELLRPILSGAGIIYVVDGSKPYGSEFETEMEILRYCGALSMAVINTITDEDFTKDWKNALSQYFRVVKLFNPMKANFEQIIELLESLSMIDDEWKAPLKRAIEILKDERERDIQKSAEVIAHTMKEVLRHRVEVSLDRYPNSEIAFEDAKKRYMDDISNLEKEALLEISHIWKHSSKKWEEHIEILGSAKLFSKESISLFGLDKKSIIAISATGGALAGSAIDAMVGGSSFLTGTLIGAGTGIYGAIKGFDKALEDRIIGRVVAKKSIVASLSNDTEFPFLILSRLLYFTNVISNRPHADRREIEIKTDSSISNLPLSQKRQIGNIHRKIAKSKVLSKRILDSYISILYTLINKNQ